MMSGVTTKSSFEASEWDEATYQHLPKQAAYFVRAAMVTEEYWRLLNASKETLGAVAEGCIEAGMGPTLPAVKTMVAAPDTVAWGKADSCRSVWISS